MWQMSVTPSVFASEVASARTLFSNLRKNPRGFTPAGSFGEVSAFFIGYCCKEPELRRLARFQEWVGSKRDGRSELAFYSHVIRELYPELPGNLPSELSPMQHAGAIDLLISWIDEFFGSLVA
jgi:hypothetical protein